MLEHLNAHIDGFAELMLDKHHSSCLLEGGEVDTDKLLYKLRNSLVEMNDYIKDYSISFSILFGENWENHPEFGFGVYTEDPLWIDLLDKFCELINKNNYLRVIMDTNFEKQEEIVDGKKRYTIVSYSCCLRKMRGSYCHEDLLFYYMHFWYVKHLEMYVENYLTREPLK